jgi:thiol-disulfide isomerase/thioredoxin
MVGELRVVGDQSTTMPGWFVDNRLGIAPVGGGPDDMALPPLVDARIVGEETLDGTACDIVRSTRARLMPGLDKPDGTKVPAREMRVIETVAYARADGLPRRAKLEIEMEGAPPDGVASVSTFTGVKINPKLGDAAFATGPIDGYRQVEPPPQMERSASGFKVKVGDAAPAFRLKDSNGREVTLESLAGRVVLLDFWATWCGPCKAAMPAIQRLHDADAPVSVFGVNVSERRPDAGGNYFAEKKYTYGCLLAGEELANAYGVTGIPTLVVIGKDGRIALLEMGFGSDGEGGLRAAIDAALAAQ